MGEVFKMPKRYHRILYVVSFVDIRDGAASSVLYQSQIDKEYFDDYLIVCKWKGKCSDNINIVRIDEDEESVKKYLGRGEVIIHYYKATASNLFSRICQMANRDVPVIMTVCQNPSYKQYLLTPYEIKNSWKIVFIDKTSYNKELISFIPKEKKTQIYLAGKRNIEITENLPEPNNWPTVVYGRGSTLSKCPRDMFEVFDNIKVLNKKFIVVGIPEGDNWVRQEAKKRNNVEVYSKLERDEWVKICASFDIFLYHIPFYSHSSIDGTLGLAMLMRHPVVYMGSDAPKERIHHGVNGFIANNKEELSEYATLLGNDVELRKRMGISARETTIREFSPEIRKGKYFEVYNNLKHNSPVRIPIKYYFKFFIRCYKDIIRSLFNIYPAKVDFGN